MSERPSAGSQIGSLCTGYGGVDLAVELVLGGRLAWYAETDPHASSVLARHWPQPPNLGDLRAIDWAAVEPVDIRRVPLPGHLQRRQTGRYRRRPLWCVDLRRRRRSRPSTPARRRGKRGRAPAARLRRRPRRPGHARVRHELDVPTRIRHRRRPPPRPAVPARRGRRRAGRRSRRCRRRVHVTAKARPALRPARPGRTRRYPARAPAHSRPKRWRQAHEGRQPRHLAAKPQRASQGYQPTRGAHLDGTVALLPTPTVADSRSAANATAGGIAPSSAHPGRTLTDAARLLPTPTAVPHGTNHSPPADGERRTGLGQLAGQLLPAPRASDTSTSGCRAGFRPPLSQVLLSTSRSTGGKEGPGATRLARRPHATRRGTARARPATADAPRLRQARTVPPRRRRHRPHHHRRRPARTTTGRPSPVGQLRGRGCPLGTPARPGRAGTDPDRPVRQTGARTALRRMAHGPTRRLGNRPRPRATPHPSPARPRQRRRSPTGGSGAAPDVVPAPL